MDLFFFFFFCFFLQRITKTWIWKFEKHQIPNLMFLKIPDPSFCVSMETLSSIMFLNYSSTVFMINCY